MMQKKSKQTANQLKQRSGHSHDDVVVEMLRTDPEFADAYLAVLNASGLHLSVARQH